MALHNRRPDGAEDRPVPVDCKETTLTRPFVHSFSNRDAKTDSHVSDSHSSSPSLCPDLVSQLKQSAVRRSQSHRPIGKRKVKRTCRTRQQDHRHSCLTSVVSPWCRRPFPASHLPCTASMPTVSRPSVHLDHSTDQLTIPFVSFSNGHEHDESNGRI